MKDHQTVITVIELPTKVTATTQTTVPSVTIVTTKTTKSKTTAAARTSVTTTKETSATPATIALSATKPPFHCTVTAKQPLPIVLNCYGDEGEIRSSCTVTAVELEVQEGDLKMTFSGRKTADRYGDMSSDTCKIGWKLCDAQGALIQNGVCYTLPLTVGETFAEATDMAFGCLENGERYLLELADTNGGGVS